MIKLHIDMIDGDKQDFHLDTKDEFILDKLGITIQAKPYDDDPDLHRIKYFIPWSSVSMLTEEDVFEDQVDEDCIDWEMCAF